MTWVVIVGWAAAALAACLGLPQVVRLLRTRQTEGVALFTWQAILAVGIGWLTHGILLPAAHMIAANAVGAVFTSTILVLLIRTRGLSPLRVVGPSLLGAAVLVLVDALFGTVVFGFVMIVPTIAANFAQTVALVRQPRVDGVAPGYLVVSLATQALWAVWGTAAGETGTVIGSLAGAAIVALNLVWWILRRRGLPPLFLGAR